MGIIVQIFQNIGFMDLRVTSYNLLLNSIGDFAPPQARQSFQFYAQFQGLLKNLPNLDSSWEYSPNFLLQVNI